MARHHPHLAPAYVADQLDEPARRDPLGHRLHVLAAAWYFFFAGFPIAFVEFMAIPLLVIGLIRFRLTYRTMLSFGAQPLFIAVTLWAIWQALSLRWSPDPEQGMRELGNCRWIWVTFMVWPVARARTLLIAALAAGLTCGAASQAVNAIGHGVGLRSLMLTQNLDRNAGWWEPIVGGTLLTAGLGLHLPAAMMGRGHERLIAAAGAVVMLAGVVATGTRGAWIASAGLIGIVGVVAGVRWVFARRTGGTPNPPNERDSGADRASDRMFAAHSSMDLQSEVRGTKKHRPLKATVGGTVGGTVGMGVAALVVVAVLVWALAGPAIGRRIELARSDLAAAARGEYRTDTGARLLMWKWAVREVRARPITGVGAGGFRPWARAHAADFGEDAATMPLHLHAHSAPLQIAATTGLVGLALAGLVMGIAIRGGLRELGPSGHEGARPGSGLGSYAAGPGFALVGMALAGLFDPVHQTTITGAWLAMLMGLCLVGRPGPTPLSRSLRVPT
ncbi:MAG: O-antigen ligase family protein [Phycisphaerales bacterium]